MNKTNDVAPTRSLLATKRATLSRVIAEQQRLGEEVPKLRAAMAEAERRLKDVKLQAMVDGTASEEEARLVREAQEAYDAAATAFEAADERRQFARAAEQELTPEVGDLVDRVRMHEDSVVLAVLKRREPETAEKLRQAGREIAAMLYASGGVGAAPTLAHIRVLLGGDAGFAQLFEDARTLRETILAEEGAL